MDENNSMCAYLLNLVFHCLDIIFTWFYLFLQLLDLVIKHKLELFQLLILLLQIIYSLFLNANMKDLEVFGKFEVHSNNIK